MRKPVIILRSGWKEGRQWEISGKAPYRFRAPDELSEWLRLKELLPLPGIGIYRKNYQDRPIKYLKVIDICPPVEREKEFNFDFEPISTGKSTSIAFSQKFPERSLYSRFTFDRVIADLKAFSEDPPQSWLGLADEVKKLLEWQDYIGKRFLRIKEGNISNDDFEDVVADLFLALGFEVTQMGHIKSGKHPDGILVSPSPYDFALIYDCKSTPNFYPIADDKRALNEYFEKYNPEIRAKNPMVKNVYRCFVAKSFQSMLTPSQASAEILIDSTSLIYLLYQRLKQGRKFTYTIFTVAGKDGEKLDTIFIDKEMDKNVTLANF